MEAQPFLVNTLNLNGGGSFATLGVLVSTLVAVIQLVIAIGLFSHGLPTRYRLPVRAAIILLLMMLSVLGVALSTVHRSGDADNSPGGNATVSTITYIPLVANFSIVLAICIATMIIMYRTSMQTAIFCATAGYTVQNLESGATELIASIMRAAGVDSTLPLPYFSNQVICMVLTYGGCYLLLVRRLSHDNLVSMENRQMLIMFPVVCLIIIGYDTVIKNLDWYGIDLSFIIILRLFHGFACIATLWTEYKLLYETRIEQNRAIAERLLHEHERQYQMSKETIEAINIKCHDLRHQIRALTNPNTTENQETIEDISRTVSIYDSSARTGNEALDTILTEKQLLCEHKGITLTCIADGRALDFMKPADLYSLFGNALDNAIEASSSLEPASRRSITLIVRQALGCVSVHVENFYEGELEFDENGIPITSKHTSKGTRDTLNHGFGTRSMIAIAKHYDGTLSATANNGTYRLDILLPPESCQ